MIDTPAETMEFPSLDEADYIALAVLSCTLDHAQWTHQAHIMLACATVRRHGARAALDVLRVAIRNYNESNAVVNGETSGYHETITTYYCSAVAHLLRKGLGVDEVIGHPLTGRTAPLAYWRREILFGTTARRCWVAPEDALPFDAPPA